MPRVILRQESVKMQLWRKPVTLPSADRLSILSAAILLAYAASRFVDIATPGNLVCSCLDFTWRLRFNIHTLVTLLVAGLTASGADLLLRDHPKMEGKPHR